MSMLTSVPETERRVRHTLKMLTDSSGEERALSERSGPFLALIDEYFFRDDVTYATSAGGEVAVPVVSSDLDKTGVFSRMLRLRPFDLVGFARFQRANDGAAYAAGAAGASSSSSSSSSSSVTGLATRSASIGSGGSSPRGGAPSSASASASASASTLAGSSGGGGGVVPAVDRRMLRVRNSTGLPVAVWAHIVVESGWFTAFVLMTIVVNALLLAVESLLGEESHWRAHQALRIIDEVTLVIYMTEIALKWIDDFRGFWYHGWNVFDFVVTVLSAVPTVIERVNAGSSSGGLTSQFKVFRTLRLLKMVAKLPRLRIIMDTIIDAFSSMTFILVLLMMLIYIFAVFAVDLFAPYTQSTDPTLKFQSKFENLQQSILSMFQVLTLDQWFFIEEDVRRVVQPWISASFFVVWVWIGAFVFRNIFVGVMVKQFQELSMSMHEAHARRRAEQRQKKKLRELNKHMSGAGAKQRGAAGRDDDDSRATAATDRGRSRSSSSSSRPEAIANSGAEEWARVVSKTMEAHQAKHTGSIRWPRDALFDYFFLLFEMQENLEEFERLQTLSAAALRAAGPVEVPVPGDGGEKRSPDYRKYE